MFAQGNISLSHGEPMPAIPVSAIFEEAGQNYVFSIESGLLVKRAVVLAERNGADNFAGVRSGLSVGTPVVRVRMNGLKAGAPVVLVSKPNEPANPA